MSDPAASDSAVSGPAASAPGRPDQAGPTGPALAQLSGAVGHDDAVVARFVADFLLLLPERLRLVESLAADDLGSVVAVLRSLETTSAMLGGEALTSTAARIRLEGEQLSDTDLDRALIELRRSATALADQLRRDNVAS